jgi:hypothetical protein
LSWIGDIDSISTWIIFDSYGDEYRELVDDPKGSNEKVLKIRYPEGSYAGVPGTGTGFYVYPFGKDVQFTVATFEFDLLFPENFDWVKGGKLPGLFGGRSKCTGGDDAIDCYSARFMWGINGHGYPYLYIPKDAPHLPEFCELTNYIDCNRKWGFNFNESSNFFVTGKWMHIKEHIELNTVNEPNGKLKVWVDGVLKDDYDKIIWRVDNQVFTLGFQIESFFGGSSDSSWATPIEQYSYFKGFKFNAY